MHDDIESRKSQHLDLALRPEVEPEGNEALFRCVRLVHRALPELKLLDVDLSTSLLGARLKAPLMIVGMTGGTERAGQVNRDLAQLAVEEGLAFGVGSMRVLLEKPELLHTFAVGAKPPLLLANLGAQQLVQRPEAAAQLVEMLGADGICIHLNPAQELVQAEGDRDFTGCLDAIGTLAKSGMRVLVKETGCGIGPDVARALASRGVRAVDVSGVGGTSWTRVEQLRAATAEARALGELLSDWGIPTAAATAAVSRAVSQVEVVASGGVRSGLDAARAIALGATVAGVALPLLRAHQSAGIEGARSALKGMLVALRAACLLTGARDLAALRASAPVLLEPLRGWIAQLAQERGP